MHKVIRTLDFYSWTYQDHDLKEYMDQHNLADGEILSGAIGPDLKISTGLLPDQVGKIHAIALLCENRAYSSVRYITHHDTIAALHAYNKVNPLDSNLGTYYLGFITEDNWFLDPWTAYVIGKAKLQIHESIYTDERRALHTHEVLFF